uniref:Uncharacterized protein n=1 Tax=Rhizophora mucronata TaxID=61149 RepID=A0A2P2QA43_RHIMU
MIYDFGYWSAPLSSSRPQQSLFCQVYRNMDYYRVLQKKIIIK